MIGRIFSTEQPSFFSALPNRCYYSGVVYAVALQSEVRIIYIEQSQGNAIVFSCAPMCS